VLDIIYFSVPGMGRMERVPEKVPGAFASIERILSAKRMKRMKNFPPLSLYMPFLLINAPINSRNGGGGTSRNPGKKKAPVSGGLIRKGAE